MLFAVKECKKSYKTWLQYSAFTLIHYWIGLNDAYKGSYVAWRDCSKHNGRIYLLTSKDILSTWFSNNKLNWGNTNAYQEE